MRILICYATTEGQTRKISRFCLDQLAAQGHTVELLRTEDAEGLCLARIIHQPNPISSGREGLAVLTGMT